MTLPTTLRAALASEDYDAVESAWLQHLADSPHDVDTFLRVADALQSSSPELARVLLELLDDQLQEQELWQQRLQVIKTTGKSFLKAGRIHETVLTTLRSLYRGREEDLEVVMPAVGLDKSRDETPKLWDKVERLHNLLTYQVGTVVAMADKGVGRVVQVNFQLQTLKVDFERHMGVAIGFRAAGKILELLPEGHILRKKLETPEQLQQLDPPALLRAVFESYDREMTGSEIREVVHGLVDKESWSSWWTAARRQPQVIASGKGRRTYHWAATSEKAAEHLWSEFEETDVAGKLQLLRRSGSLDEGLRGRMLENLNRELEESLPRNPAAAFEIWAVLDRITGGTTWDPRSMLSALDQPVSFLQSISNRATKQRAFTLLRDVREDWLKLFAEVFPGEEDSKNLAWLADQLAQGDKALADEVFGQVLTGWRRHPAAFVYLAERAAEDAALRSCRPLRWVRQILSATGEDAFSGYKNRLLVLCDSGGTLPRVLSLLEQADAKAAEETLERARGLGDHQRYPLLNALHLKFPALRKEQEQPLYTTPESLERKREELRTLLEEEIPANRKAIEEARALGDLKENFEYKSARQRHEYLSARATALSRDLERAKVLEPASIDPMEIRIGTSTVLSNAAGERRYTILGPWESSPEKGILSFESELAQRMLGKKVGDHLEAEGETFEIVEIERFG